MRDLFHQDVVEMIERETRKYSVWSITHPDHPDFGQAFDLLWETFGPHGEMERVEVIRQFLLEDPFEPLSSGTFSRYFFLVAKDQDGHIRGVRDGCVMVNPSYAPDLCVIYLSHIYMLPQARGTVLSYWLRISPVDIAVQFLADLHKRHLIQLPAPEARGRYFGMKINLTAEMEYFDPENRVSWARILFYGRGGFDAINPRHFPYQQPDFRDPEEIRATGNRPVPFMLLLRRMGRERQATLPIEEAQAVMKMLYDDFATHCAPEFLENSLQLVLNRLEARALTRNFVELLPLPTGPRDLTRFKRLFRYPVYTRYYGDAPMTQEYLQSGIRETLAKHPKYLEDALSRIAAELELRPPWVYANRDKDTSWEGVKLSPAGDGQGDPA